MIKKIKLGKGLDALLLGSRQEQIQNSDILKQIPLDKLQRGKFQPRNDISSKSLTKLVESIKYKGVIQPIIVRQIGDKYEVIAGERRWKASKLAKIDTIPAIIRPMSDKVALAIGLIENIQREALSPLEEAKALVQLIEDFNITHTEVSTIVGRSRSSVSNLIRLLQLEEKVKQLLNDNAIEMGHARALLALDYNMQLKIAQQITIKQLSVRQTENLIKNILRPHAIKRQTPEYITAMEKSLSTKTNKKIKIKIQGEKGKITISFNSRQELDHLTKQLLVN